MITVRKSQDRGHVNHGWLDSHHSFSFGQYRDPAHMGFSALRVINEDRVIAGAGFSEHGHDNMEILSYVVSGALEHTDSMGTGSVIRPFDIQLMSAGNGVVHSEFNASRTEDVHFLQIWIMPNVRNEEPSYQQVSLSPDMLRNQLVPIVTPDGEGNSLRVKQDAQILNGLFDAGFTLNFVADSARSYWVQIVSGEILINGETLMAGDGAAISDTALLEIKAVNESNILLFDLPQA